MNIWDPKSSHRKRTPKKVRWNQFEKCKDKFISHNLNDKCLKINYTKYFRYTYKKVRHQATEKDLLCDILICKGALSRFMKLSSDTTHCSHRSLFYNFLCQQHSSSHSIPHYTILVFGDITVVKLYPSIIIKCYI